MADVTDTLYAGQAMIGYGAQFLVLQGSAVYAAVPDVNSITPGDWTTNTIQKTHLRSTARHHELMATLRSTGAFAMSANYRPGHGAHQTEGGDGFDATHNLPYLWVNVVENGFRISLPEPAETVSPDTSGEVLSFTGVLTKYQIGSIELEEKIGVEMEVQPLGAITLP